MYSSSETAAGQGRAWTLIQKLGEGDAGEVYRVASLTDGRSAVLKRPRRGSFPSDMIRQAAQIEKEARILKTLSAINTANRLMQIPSLLDQSKPGTEYSERFFIVISSAPGINLIDLHRFLHFELDEQAANPATSALSAGELAFLKSLHKLGRIPDLVLIRSIVGTIEFLEAIHTLQTNSSSEPSAGVIWNDIKPDHIFWDLSQNRFTLIDWGNAQYIEPDGITKDRQYSRLEDYLQLINSMGKFLHEAAPGLIEKLAWPEDLNSANVYSRGILPIKEHASELLAEEERKLQHLRQEESDILRISNPTLKETRALAQTQERIISLGEMPDTQYTTTFLLLLTHNILASQDYSQFRSLNKIIQRFPGVDLTRLQILEDILDKDRRGENLSSALLAGLNGDWPSALWGIRLDSSTCLGAPGGKTFLSRSTTLKPHRIQFVLSWQ